ncbi:unnamed protein product [Tuber melanosporum]|jgi:hypothetical protein|uniref:(Perigord truffle) hypothetical protein n=1 Tax=Tuber melanosporum (strain Mel28) TaxID=656061 RepID=D5GLA1_TUBMM|nr:uncharacterized protein GSTUM_00010090001 [Tuber melanosporum]CAZ85294.1 unnamed protein product [Tuber melanosporum]
MLRLIINKQTFKAISIHPYRPHRGFSTVPGRNTDSDSHHDNDYHHDSSGGCAGSGSPPGVTSKDFANLDKDVSNIKLKLDYIQSGQSEMRADIKDLGNKTDKKFDKTDSKIDRIFYGVITTLVGFVLKGGFDYYQAAKK